MPQPLLTRYLQPLIAGRRTECFNLIQTAVAEGVTPQSIVEEVVWPALAQIERLYQDDRINLAVEHMASRINRTVADQLQAHMPVSESKNKRIIIACADGFREEIGAQIVADLFQSDGWEVFFVGGGVPDDELLALVGQHRPHALLLFGADPGQVPLIRRLVEIIREIGVCPTMNIVVSGGLFNRAEGLWQEVGVDAFAPTATGVLELVNSLPPRMPGPPRRGSVKKRQRRRRSAEAEVAKSISKAELALEAGPATVKKRSTPPATLRI